MLYIAVLIYIENIYMTNSRAYPIEVYSVIYLYLYTYLRTTSSISSFHIFKYSQFISEKLTEISI